MCECVGWVDRWVGGWVSGCTGGWVGGSILDRWIGGWVGVLKQHTDKTFTSAQQLLEGQKSRLGGSLLQTKEHWKKLKTSPHTNFHPTVLLAAFPPSHTHHTTPHTTHTHTHVDCFVISPAVRGRLLRLPPRGLGAGGDVLRGERLRRHL